MFRRFFARQSWLGQLIDRQKKNSRRERRDAFQTEMMRHLRVESLESRLVLATFLQGDAGSPFNVATGDRYFDSGNVGGNYSNSENSTITFSAGAGARTRVAFSTFNTESFFDFLRVHDGPNTGSTLLGVFDGVSIPGPFTSTGNELTFQFTSDSSVIRSGWAASITVINTATDPTTNAGAGNNNVQLRVSPTQNDLTEVLVDGLVVQTFLSANLNSLTIDGQAGDDALTVDFANGNPVPVNGLTFNGGEAGEINGDSLSITGFNIPAGTVTSTYTGLESGTVRIGAGSPLITYSQIEPLTLAGTAADLIIDLSQTGVQNPDVVLSDDGGVGDPDATNTANTSAISGSTFEYTQFTNPTNSLTVTLGNLADTISVQAMDALFAPVTGTTINGGTLGDSIEVQVALAGGGLSVLAGAGTDTLRGPNAVANWNITGANAGNVTGFVSSFTGVENLVGNAAADTFTFSDAQGVTGTINGAGGTDTLDYSAYTTGVSANLGGSVASLTGSMEAEQEVPPTTSIATGLATITNYDTVTKTFDINVAVNDLAPGLVNGFHLHRGAIGTNGPVIVNFGFGSLVPAGTGFTFSASGLALINPQDEAALIGGATYVNVHTGAFPGGAIRGQVFSTANAAGTPTATGTAGILSIENVTGGTAPDGLVGNNLVNTLRGGSGADILVGAQGGDVMSGGGDDDILVWSNGDGSDVMDGDGGTDTIYVNGNVVNPDTFRVDAGGGGRVAFARTSAGPFTLDIGTAETLSVNGIGGDDSMSVNSLAGVANLANINLNGLAGNDLFNVTPDANVAVSVKGGNPLFPSNPGDTLIYNSAGNSIPAITGPGHGTISQGGLQNVTYRSIEDVQTAGGGQLDVVVDANADPAPGSQANDGVADGFRVVRNGANLEVYVNLTLAQSFVFANVNSLGVSGSGDDDTLTVDYTNGNPIPAGGLTFNGGGEVTLAGDALNIVGNATPFTSFTVNHTGFSPDGGPATANGFDGNVVIDDGTVRTITFTGLEPINAGDATNIVFNLPATNDVMTLADAGGGQFTVDVTSGTAETVTMNYPAAGGSLTINMGDGNDSLTVTNTLLFNATTDLIIDGQGDTTGDSINLNAAAGFTVTGDMALTAENIAQTGPVTVTGTTTFTAGATNSITLIAGNDFVGNVTVVSANDVSLNEINSIQFGGVSTISGNFVVTAAGAITDSAGATLAVTGLVNVNGSSISLGTGTLNAGTLRFNSAGAVVISEDSSMDIVGVNTAGSADLDSTAAISDVGATSVTVTGLADVNGTSISLGGGTFNAGSLTFNSAGAAIITEDSGTNIAGANTALSLDLDSAGAINNAGGATMTITNLADFNGTSITLNNAASHNFGTLTFNSAGAVVIVENSGTAFFGTSTGTTITVNSAGAMTDSEVDPANEITGTDLILTAVGGIGVAGARIHIAVTNLDVSNTTSGGIFVTDTAGGLVLTDLGGPNSNAVDGVGGSGEIRASSPLTINADAITTGGMTYTAADSVTNDVDHLTVTGVGTEVRDNTALVLNAGDDLNIGVGTTVEVTGVASTLNLNIDALGGGVADTGGETANLNGTLATDGQPIQVTGGGEGDAFIIDDNGGTAVNSGTVNNILNNIVITAGGGADTLTLDDTGDAGGDTVDIDEATADVISGQIDNGSTITYNPTLETIVINAGSGADSYNVAPDANTAITIDANNPLPPPPGDLLTLDLAGVDNPILTPTGPGAGTLTSSNRATVTFSDFETVETETAPNQGLDFVLNMATLGFQNGVADTIDLQRGLSAGQFTVQIRINDNLLFELEERTLDSMRFIGSTDNETLQFTETVNGIVTLTGPTQGTDGVETGENNPNIPNNPDIQFDGGLGTDAIAYIFLAGGTLYNQVYAIGDGAGGGSGVGTSEGEILTQDTGAGTQLNRLYFTGLEPITTSMAGGTLTVLGDVDANTINVIDGPLTTTRIQAQTGANPFETFDFAANSFTALEIYGMGGADRIDLISLDVLEISLATIRLDGDADTDGDASADTIVVRSTTNLPATSTVSLFGGLGDDDFVLDGNGDGNAAVGTVNGIGAAIVVSPLDGGPAPTEEAGGTDELFIIDTDDIAPADTITITSTTIEGLTGSAAPVDITYGGSGAIESIVLFTGNVTGEILNIQSTRAGSVYNIATQGGADTVNVSGAAPTLIGAGAHLNGILGQINLDTGAPVTGDVLNVSDYDAGVGDTTYEVEDTNGAAAGEQTVVRFLGGVADDIRYNANIVDRGATGSNAANAGNLEVFRFIGSDIGDNIYTIDDTTATVSNLIEDGDATVGGTSNAIFHIQANTLQGGATNTFNGFDGNDDFNVNFASDTAVSAAAVTTFQINGGAPGADPANRDRVDIDASADTIARIIGMTYTSAASGDLNVTGLGTPTFIDLNEVEQVNYVGGGADDTLSVTAVAGNNDILSVTPLSANSANVFLNGTPFLSTAALAPFNSPATNDPGVAGSINNTGPDINIAGILQTGFTAIGNGGADFDRLVVNAPTENLASVFGANTPSAWFGNTFGSGSVAVAAGSDLAYDVINVTDTQVQITNANFGGAMLRANYTTGTFRGPLPTDAEVTVNSGEESDPLTPPNPQLIADDVTATLSNTIAFQLNGGAPPLPGAPPLRGDRLNVNTPGNVTAFSDIQTPPNVTLISVGSQPLTHNNFELVIVTVGAGGPSSTTATIVGDNNGTTPIADDIRILGRDVDSSIGGDADGANEFVLFINGSGPVFFRNVEFLNVTGLALDDDITIDPYADNTPRGWGIDVRVDGGTGDDDLFYGNTVPDLFIDTAPDGSVSGVSENITVAPTTISGGGQIRVPGVVTIDFTTTEDLSFFVNDGAAGNTDTLEILGSALADTLTVNFTNAGDDTGPWVDIDLAAPATQLVQVERFARATPVPAAAPILSPLASVNFALGDGDDTITITGRSTASNTLAPTTINVDSGNPSASDTINLTGTAGADDDYANTPGAIDLSGTVLVTLALSPTSTVNYINTENIRIHGGGGIGEDQIELNGTGAPNAFTITLDDTQIAGVDINGDAADDRRNFSARVDGGPTISAFDLGQAVGPVNTSDLTLNGLGGDDTFSITHFADAAIDDINIDAGAPSASDSVQIVGTAGDDTFSFLPTGPNSGQLDVTSGVIPATTNYILTNTEALEIDGAGELVQDRFNMAVEAVTQGVLVHRGAALDEGVFEPFVIATGQALLPVTSKGAEVPVLTSATIVLGVVTIDAVPLVGAAIFEDDEHSTSATITIVDLDGVGGVNDEVLRAGPFSLDITAVNTLTVDGMGGDDTITVDRQPAGALVPLTIPGPGGGLPGLIIVGGDNGSGRDSVVINGSTSVLVDDTIGVNLATSDVTGVVGSPIDLTGVELLTIDAQGQLLTDRINVTEVGAISALERVTLSNAEILTATGTAGDDTINVQPTAAGAGSFWASSGQPIVTYSGVSDDLFTVTGNGGILSFDVLNVIGTEDADIFASEAATRVAVSGGDVNFADIDRLDITAGNGADRVGLTHAIAVPIVVDAGSGNDLVHVSTTARVTLLGGAGDDALFAGSGIDRLEGGDGNDVLVGGPGDDLVIGGAGSDTFVWNPGDADDLLEGDEGDDTLAFAGANGTDTYTISSDNGRVIFQRQPGNVGINMGGVENINSNSETIELSGRKEVPANASTSRGFANFTFNPATGLFDIRIFVLGIAVGDLIDSHIHMAIPGSNGPVVIPFGGGAGYTAVAGGLELVLTGLSLANIAPPAGFTAQEVLTEILLGRAYFNVHTTANPGGELRGNVVVSGPTSGSGGGDTLVVRDLTGTPLRSILFNAGNEAEIRTGAPLIDTVTIEAPNTANSLSAAITNLNDNNFVVSGLPYNIIVVDSDGNIASGPLGSLRDAFNLNGNGGNDTLTVQPGVENLAIVALNGGDGDDVLIGNAQFINGNAGNDTLIGGAGNQTMDGGAGDDTFVGNGGTDAIGGGAGSSVGDTILLSGTSGDDDFTLILNATGHMLATINTLVTTYTNFVGGPIATSGIEQILVQGLAGNDSLTIDETNGLILLAQGIEFNGGTGSDSLTLLNGVAQNAFYNVGPTNDAGSIVHDTDGDLTTTADQQRVTFTGLEPVLDLVPGPLQVNATNADNAINYTEGPNSGTALVGGAGIESGQVSIDGMEPIEFANKTTLTINALAGNDVINLNDTDATAPTGLAGDCDGVAANGVQPICVNGGDSTDDDSLIVNGIAAANVIDFTPIAADGGIVAGAQSSSVLFATVESLVINGLGGNDTLDVNLPDPLGGAGTFTSTVVLTPGSTIDSGSVQVDSLVPMSFKNLGATGVLTLTDSDLADDDRLIYNGTSGSDTFSVPDSIVPLLAPPSILLNSQIAVGTTAVENYTLWGLGGDDTFNITAQADISIRVEGDEPGGSDILNFSSTGATLVQLGLSEIEDAGVIGSPDVTYSGIETINIDANGNTLGFDTLQNTFSAPITEIAVDDDVTVTVFSATAGRVQHGPAVQKLGELNVNPALPVVNYTEITGVLSVDLALGEDTLTVVGNALSQTFNINASGAAVPVFPYPAVPANTVQIDDANDLTIDGTITWSNNESVQVFGLEGDDTFNVIGGAIPVFVDGGDPIGLLVGDAINVFGASAFAAGPEIDEGGFTTAGGSISFDHIERIGRVVPTAGCPFVIIGTNGDDDITMIARDASTHPTADGVRDFTFSMNGAGDILVIDAADVFIDPLSGEDDVVIRTRAPNLANWNVNVRIVGGPPSAVTGDQGDVVEIETPGAIVDRAIYTPTGPETGILLLDDNNNGVFDAASDTLIQILANLPAVVCPGPPPFTYTSTSPGGIEQLIYDGEGGNDLLTVRGDRGVVGAATDDRFIHTPGATIDAGTIRIDTTLVLEYQNLGAAATVTADGLGGDDTLVALGTDGSDEVTVAFTALNAVDIDLDSTSGTYVDLLSTAVENYEIRTLEGDDDLNLAGPGVVSWTSLAVFGGGPSAGSDTFHVTSAIGNETITIRPDLTQPDNQDVVLSLSGTVDVDGYELITVLGQAAETETVSIELGAGDNTARVERGSNFGTLSVASDLVTSDSLVNIQVANADVFTIVGNAGSDVVTFKTWFLAGGAGTSYRFDGGTTDTLVIEGSDGGAAAAGAPGNDNWTVRNPVQGVFPVNPPVQVTDNNAGGLVTVTVTAVNIGLGRLVLNTLGGDDLVTVDVGATDVIATPITFDGGANSDSLTVSGTPATAVDEVIYSPGPATGEGRLTYESAADARLMTIDFANLEPVVDLVLAANLTVNGTNAANAINYSEGSVVTRGLVAVDAFETIEFSNKTTLTINGLAGNDVVNIANFTTPTGLTGIEVNGGDPGAGDTLVITGSTTANAFEYAPDDIDGGQVLITGLPTVTFTTISGVTIDGRSDINDDTLTVRTEAGTDFVTLVPGANFDSGVVHISSTAGTESTPPLTYLALGEDATLTFLSGAGAGARQDEFEYLGTANSDTFTVSAAGQINLNRQIDVNAAGANRLVLRGLEGDDVFEIPGGHPFISGIRVDAGDPSASDVLNFAAVGEVTLNLQNGTLDDAGNAAAPDVTYQGIEIVNVDLNTFDLNVEATTDDDDVTVTVLSRTSGRIEHGPAVQKLGEVQRASIAPVVNYSDTATDADRLVLDLLDGEDTLIVVGNALSQNWAVNVPAFSVTIDDTPFGGVDEGLVTWTGTTLESLQVYGLEGADVFTVTAGAIPVFVDGGDPIGVAVGGDSIFVIGAIGFFPGPESDEGGFLAGGGPISFDHIEVIGGVVPSPGCPFVIIGTNGDDDITVIARDDSTHVGADGVRDFTFSVNGAGDVLVLNAQDVFIDPLSGDDDVVIRTRAPNLANWNVNVRVVGGPPSAITGDQGDVLEVETPGAIVDRAIYTPTGSETGTLLLDDNNNGIFDLATDTLIQILANLPVVVCPGPPPVTYTSTSPGGIEQLIYDGEGGNDILTIVGTAGDDAIRHSPSDSEGPDEGSFRVNTLLAIAYQNLGAGRLLVNGGTGDDELEVEGTVESETFTVDAIGVTVNEHLTLELVASTIEVLVLEGYEGDDTFILNLPLTAGVTEVHVNGGGPGNSDVLTVNGAAAVVEAFELTPETTRGNGLVTVTTLGGALENPYTGIQHIFLAGNAGTTDSVVINDDGRDNIWDISAGTIGDRVQIADRESIDINTFGTVRLNNNSGTDLFRVRPSNLSSFATSFTVAGDPALPLDDVLELLGTPGNDLVTSTATAISVNGVAITVGNVNFAAIRIFTFDGSDNIDLDLDLPGVDAIQKFVDAGAGNDLVDLSGSVDATIFGGLDDDFLIGSPDSDFIDGGPGNDTILGLGANDTIYGGPGNDILIGGAGADSMFGQDGSDILVWNPGDGNDLMEGDDGRDKLQFLGGAAADDFTLSPNATRLRFERQPGNIVLDVAGVEEVDVDTSITFAGRVTGAQENPPVATAAQGFVDLVYDSDTNRFALDVFVTGIAQADLTLSHIHVGVVGVNGGIIFDLGAGAAWTPQAGGLRRTVTDAIFPLANIADLLAGNTYVNVHTTANPGGEVRGQLNVASGAPALAGADDTIVNDLFTTDVESVDIGLGANNGGATDNATDTVLVNGRSVADNIVISTDLGPAGFANFVNVAGLAYDVNISNAIAGAPNSDRLTVSGNEGNDTIKANGPVEATINITLNGDDGDDFLSADAILNGGAGNDFLEGGAGDDTLNGNAGEDTMIGNGGNDTFDGGPDFDTILILGTSGNDRIDVNQTAPTTLVYTVNGTTETDTLVLVAGVRTVERALVQAGDGDDIIRVQWIDSLGQSAAVDSLRMDVEGGDDFTRDRLAVVDNGTGDLILYRKGESDSTGSMTIGPAEDEPLEAVFQGIEFAEPVVGTDGRVIVFKHDPYEFNNDRFLATHLGADDVINVDPTIDPGADVPFGLPSDQDFYRFEAKATGTLDFQVFFEELPTLVSGRAGLPGDGNLDIRVLDANGTVIAGTGAFGDDDPTNQVDVNLDGDAFREDERIRIPVVQGQIYYLQVLAAGAAINTYNLTIINEPAPVPFDLELQDLPVDPAYNCAVPTLTNSDSGRSHFDNVTCDNTPTIVFRLDDGLLLNDLPGNNATDTPPDQVIPIPFQAGPTPAAPGYAIAIFDEGSVAPAPGNASGVNIRTPLGFATQVEPGLYRFTTPVLNEGSHFLTARVQMIDPSTPTQAGFGARSLSLEIVVDRTPPPVFFGSATDPNDGLVPDPGVIPQPPLFVDVKTRDQTPEFWGTAEANAIIRVFADSLPTNGVLDAGDVLLGLTVALPEDGTNQFLNGQWRLSSNVDLNDPAFFPLDGLRRIFITAEDLAGNVNPGVGIVAQTLDIFVDTQGPQVTGVFITNAPAFDIFNPKPTLAPTPLIDQLSITVRDLPNRVVLFPNPALNPAVAVAPGHFLLKGDYNGVIPIAGITFTPNPSVPGSPATGVLVLTFFEPLPDDRFTLTLSEDLVDDVGNKLDGESNAIQPLETPTFPSGDGQPGGDFVARFTVDSRPEVGTWSSGSVYIDTNGNTIFDPDNLDFVNRDITYAFGYGSGISDGKAFTSDDIFAGNFSLAPGSTADGFDKLGAYGLVGTGLSGKWRWLIDVNNDGVPDVNQEELLKINGLPIAGNFDGNAINGDEVAVFTGTEWYFDTDHNFALNASTRLVSALRGYPIVGDFDGDGKDDLATWADDTFSFDLSSVGTGGPIPSLPGLNGAIDATIKLGFIGPRERPVAADLDRDGIDDIGLWVPDRSGVAPHEAAEWYFLVSNDRNPADGINDRVVGTVNTLAHPFKPVPFGKDFYVQFGNQFAIPIIGNFDPPAALDTRVESPVNHTNSVDADDVNADGLVTPIDALILINQLNDQAFSGDPLIKSGKLQGIATAPNYVDTNRDKFISTGDALKVINRLNGAQSEGEGEAAQDAAVVIQFSTVVGQQLPDSQSTDLQSLVIAVTSLSRGAATHDLAISQLSTGDATENDVPVDIGVLEVHDELFSQIADEETVDLVNDLDVLTKNESNDDVDQALEDVLNELFS